MDEEGKRGQKVLWRDDPFYSLAENGASSSRKIKSVASLTPEPVEQQATAFFSRTFTCQKVFM